MKSIIKTQKNPRPIRRGKSNKKEMRRKTKLKFTFDSLLQAKNEEKWRKVGERRIAEGER
jgi:hypothetical protein